MLLLPILFLSIAASCGITQKNLPGGAAPAPRIEAAGRAMERELIQAKITKTDGEWRLDGRVRVRGAATRGRREINVEAVDAAGKVIVKKSAVAHLLPSTGRFQTERFATFTIPIPDAAGVSTLRLSK